MQLHGTSVIGFGRGAANGAGAAAVDAATGQPLNTTFHWATDAEVKRALQLAHEAFGVFRRVADADRAAFLKRIAADLEANADPIVARAMRETALPEARLRGEMGRTCGQLRMFAGVLEAGRWLDARIDTADPDRKPVPKPDVRSMRMPLGPVVVFGASNFPLAFSVAGGDTASALAAGCCVIVKAHNAHMGTSELVGSVIAGAAKACGMPEGVFSLLYGGGVELGLTLVRDRRVKAVGFTGSRRAGQALMAAAAGRDEPIPVYAEMSSVNPLFVLPGALAARGEAIAAGLAASVTLGVGQFCTKPGLVFVPGGEGGERFVEQVRRNLADAAPATMLTGAIAGNYRDGVRTLSGSDDVASVLVADADDAEAVTPTLLTTDAASLLDDPALQDEVFGPCVLIVRCDRVGHMLAAAESLEGQLTATIHGEADELPGQAELIAALELRAGRLIFNGFPTGVEVCHAMHHGGPFPATSDGRTTSVGSRAIDRFTRPVCYQGWPDASLPPALRTDNPQALPRLVDGVTPGRERQGGDKGVT